MLRKELPYIQVNMLGALRLRYSGQEVGHQASRSQKLRSVLAYFMIHRNRVVSREELLDRFWNNDRSGNPNSALKTLIFRLRAVLAKLLGDDAQPLISHQGGYQWNEALPCKFDIDEFELLCRTLEDVDLPLQVRLEQLEKIFQIYQGDFLDELSFDLWSVSLRNRYHNMYLERMKEYAALLQERHEYTLLYRICHKALEIDPLDETLHACYIRAMMGLGDEQKAEGHYHQVAELLTTTFGVAPSAELRALHRKLIHSDAEEEAEPEMPERDLWEGPRRRGAFLCSYRVFRETFQIEARRSNRSQHLLHLVLLHVTPLTDSETDRRAVDNFQDVLVNSLRSGDVVSRFQTNQYLVLVQTMQAEGPEIAIARVMEAAQKAGLTKRLEIRTKIQPIVG